MQIASGKVVRMLACTEEEAEDLRAAGKRPPTRAIGVRLVLTCGTSVFWSFKWRTVSVKYTPVVKRYRNGAVVTDECGRIIFEKPSKNGAVSVGGLFDQYGYAFALLVMAGIDQVEKENAR